MLEPEEWQRAQRCSNLPHFLMLETTTPGLNMHFVC
jgi:hypothetical protein